MKELCAKARKTKKCIVAGTGALILLVLIVGLFIGLLDPIEIERGQDNVTIVTSKSSGTYSLLLFFF